jgi:hypothetical protein
MSRQPLASSPTPTPYTTTSSFCSRNDSRRKERKAKSLGKKREMRGKKECSQNLGPAHQKEGCQRMQSACRSWVEDEQQTYRQDNREEQLVLEFQLFPGSPLSRSVAGHRVCLFWTSVKGRSNPGGASAMSLPLSGIQTGRPEGTKNQDSGTQ